MKKRPTWGVFYSCIPQRRLKFLVLTRNLEPKLLYCNTVFHIKVTLFCTPIEESPRLNNKVGQHLLG